MDLNRGLDDLVAVALVAALAPLVVAALPGPRIPQVVIFLLGGVLIGPHVLGVAETSNIQLLLSASTGSRWSQTPTGKPTSPSTPWAAGGSAAGGPGACGGGNRSWGTWSRAIPKCSR